MNVYQQRSPWELNSERLVSDALATSQTPGEVLRDRVRPPLPLVQPFPPRFGYPSVQARIPTIRGVLDIDRNYRNRRDDISGGPWEYQSSPRYSMQGQW